MNTGYELNFWALPIFTPKKTASVSIVNIASYLDIMFYLDAASQSIGFGININGTN